MARSSSEKPRAKARGEGVAGLVRTIALLLTVVTGATGLIYEITWQRFLTALLGSQSEA